MEYLNRVQIRGKVGAVRLNEIHGIKVANFSVSTECLNEISDGSLVNESTSFTVCGWQSEAKFNLEKLAKGDNVYVEGRFRTMKYTNHLGVEKVLYEIVASSIELVED